MGSTLENPAITPTRRKGVTIAWWSVTALFCLEMLFTAYYELLVLPAAAQAFTRLGYPASYFRAELSLAKVLGILILLIPIRPARLNAILKEWAYAGFAFNLISALIAHTATHDRPASFIASSITSILWLLSYYFWHQLQPVATDEQH